MKQLQVKITDGGRSKYFKGTACDCVTRAIAIATQKDYKEVYDTIKNITKQSPRNGVSKENTRKVMQHFGALWHPCMKVGTGCKVHLADEGKNGIPMHSRIICNLSGHVCAVIEGVINDTHDPSRNGTRCVYGYWYFI